MRIITGTLKGRKLIAPDGDETRPTSDRTKEGMFNVVSARRYFENLHVLDLFGGSGNLGFEAISRGASHVTFVDSGRNAIRAIQKNADLLDVKDKIQVVQSDVHSFLQRFTRPFDLVFADPPYDYEYMHELIDLTLSGGWLHEDGWLLLEHDKRHNFSEHPSCVFSKPYGRTIVTIFINPSAMKDDTEES